MCYLYVIVMIVIKIKILCNLQCHTIYNVIHKYKLLLVLQLLFYQFLIFPN